MVCGEREGMENRRFSMPSLSPRTPFPYNHLRVRSFCFARGPGAKLTTVALPGRKRLAHRCQQTGIALMGTIECQTNFGKAQCIRIDQIPALPTRLELLLKIAQRAIFVRVAKAI